MNSMMTSLFFFVDVDRRLLIWTIVGRPYERYHAHHRLSLPTIFVLYVGYRHLLHSSTVDLAAVRFPDAYRLLPNSLFAWRL